jgi:hypothetical protein
MRLALFLFALGVLTCQRPPPVASAARHLEEPEDPPGFWAGQWGQGYEHREEPPPRQRVARAARPRAAPVQAPALAQEVEAFDSSLLEQVDAALAETEEALGAVRRARK